MAEEKYNPETDSWEKQEEPRLNPATGISNFTQPKRKIIKETISKKPSLSFGERVKIRVEANKEFEERKEEKGLRTKQFERLNRMIKPRPIKERLKVMRLSNMLEKKRLLNQIQKLKLQKQMDTLRKKGVLKQIIAQPIRMPTQLYPAYSTPEIMGDIDSAFNADIGSGEKSMWGSEDFYGGENYYNEDFYSNEFDNDPLMHLAIKIRTGVSPLLW